MQNNMIKLIIDSIVAIGLSYFIFQFKDSTELKGGITVLICLLIITLISLIKGIIGKLKETNK